MKSTFFLNVAIALVFMTAGLFVLGFSLPGGDAVPNSEDRALIVVVNLTAPEAYEVEKADSLYSHLVSDGWDGDNIEMLSPSSGNHVDGTANLMNFQSALLTLSEDSEEGDRVLIYVSDHGIADGDAVYLRFSDGSIDADTIDDYLDDIDCSELTFIMGGDMSGLAGDALSESGRDIICSMGEEDQYEYDQFNMARSLVDPLSDSNQDGVITFVEAAEREILVMAGYTSQEPSIWYG